MEKEIIFKHKYEFKRKHGRQAVNNDSGKDSNNNNNKFNTFLLQILEVLLGDPLCVNG